METTGGWMQLVPVEWDTWGAPGGGTLSAFPFIKKGDRVRCRRKGGTEWREGTVALIWLGVCEVVDVDHGAGAKVSYYPAEGLGDDVQVRVGGA